MTDKETIEILKDDEMYITDSFYREFRTTIADKYTKAFETVLNLVEKQQEELEKQDKIIDEMAIALYDEWYMPALNTTEEIKEHFKKKVEDK